MKKYFYILLFSLPSFLFAQVEVEVTIENITISGTDVLFDIYLRATSSDELYLGNADFKLNFNSANFTNPNLSVEAATCTFVVTDPGTVPFAGFNNLVAQGTYFNGISPSISGNELIINLNGPAPGTQTAFDQGVAVIDNTASTHRLGTFRLSGISNASGMGGFTWITTGTIPTRVFSLGENTPFTSTMVTMLTATNPTDFTLPVELTKIEAIPTSAAIAVTWESSSEQDFSGYEVERSTDGKTFDKIAWVAGKGNAVEAASYSHKDAAVKENITYYYRLKMIDLDGTYEYSPIRSAAIEGSSDWKVEVYPNPVSEAFTVTVNSDASETGTLSIFNINGQLVHRQPLSLSEGLQQYVIQRSDLSAGIYYMQVQTTRHTHNEQIVFAQ